MLSESTLIYALSGLLAQSPKSIEILPGDIDQWVDVDLPNAPRPTPQFPFLFSEHNLGIPRKVLYKLYPLAISIFQATRKMTDREQLKIEALVASSSVILLTNGAHQTALNMRKRLVQSSVLSPEKELLFTAALLSSRSCAKESILWDHRRWLLRRIYGKSIDVGNAELFEKITQMPLDTIQEEFALVYRASETYSRNYHAWNHFYLCICVLDSSIRRSNNANRREAYFQAMTAEFVHLRLWVERHISDHSAIAQLINVAYRFRDVEQSHFQLLSQYRLDFAHAKTSFDHALSLVELYPSHESLWLYLRATVDLNPDEIAQSEIISRVEAAASASSNPYASKCLAWWAHKAGSFTFDAERVRSLIAGDQTYNPDPHYHGENADP